MKPPKFAYHAPGTLDEAIAVLSRYGGEARLLAGGQSLVPMLNLRLASPKALVDLGHVTGLAGIREEGGRVCIGAMTRQRAIEFSALVAQTLPLLREGVRWVGHLPTRTRGTIGGSIAHADPAAELPMLLLALDGEVVAHGPRGSRAIAGGALFETVFTTRLASDEILEEVRFPVMAAGTGYAVEEFARRHGDFAIVAVAAVIERAADRCTKARIAAAGAAPTPLRLRAAEEILEQRGLGDAAIAAAAACAAELVSPGSDLHASADYRRHLTQELVGRALRSAVARAA